MAKFSPEELFRAFVELSPEDQQEFWELCIDTDLPNRVKQQWQNEDKLWSGLRDWMRRAKTLEPVRSFNRRGKKKNAARDAEVVRLRKQNLTFGEIVRDKKVIELNGGHRMTEKHAQTIYSRAKKNGR